MITFQIFLGVGRMAELTGIGNTNGDNSYYMY